MKNRSTILLNLIVFTILLGSFATSGISITQETNSDGSILSEEQLLYNDSVDEKPYEIVDAQNYHDSTASIDSARTGTQKYAIVCVRFADIPVTRFTAAEIDEVMSWTNLYWQNASYNMIDIAWEVAGWYTLNQDLAFYGDLSDSFYTIIISAALLAINDIDFEQYDHIMVFINAEFPGISTVGKTYVPVISKNKAFSLTMVSENDPHPISDVYGRIVHEMGHAFGLGHTHGDGESDQTKYYASEFSLMARGYPSALNTYSQLFDKKSGWFDTITNEIVVNPGIANNYTLYPRYLDTSGITQCLKVKVTDDYYYRVETIRLKDEDSWVLGEGVYIYEVDIGASNSDECTDMDSTPNSATPDFKDCLWQVGDRFEDTDHNIVIEVKEEIGETFKVFVQNMASGQVDLAISEWGGPPGITPPYESEDIWIDSPINGFGNLRYHDEFNNPIGNGDEPLINHVNRLYAMVHNIGDADVVDFDVHFYQNYPLGAGDDSAWDLIDIVAVDLLPQGESLAVYAEWTPVIANPSGVDFTFNYHSCVRVHIYPDEFEVTDGNNAAQENIYFFEATADDTTANLKLPSTFFEPITTTIKVQNPYPETKELYVGMVDINENWNATANGLYEWHTFTAHETKEFEITITPNDAVRFTDSAQPSLYVGVIQSEEEDIYGFQSGSHMITLPSLTLKVIAMYRSELELDAAIRTGNIELFGTLIFTDDVPVNDQPITDDRNLLFEITNTDTDTTEYYVVTFNADGSFDYQYPIILQGNYSITAYFGGTNVVAKSYSITLLVDTISGEIGTSSPNGFIPGFEFLLVVTVLSISTVVIKVKRRKE
ncbi:MAG: hypothetical protein ACTSQK_06170 [Candidatus Heimdallarchaeota archaeon]